MTFKMKFVVPPFPEYSYSNPGEKPNQFLHVSTTCKSNLLQHIIEAANYLVDRYKEHPDSKFENIRVSNGGNINLALKKDKDKYQQELITYNSKVDVINENHINYTYAMFVFEKQVKHHKVLEKFQQSLIKIYENPNRLKKLIEKYGEDWEKEAEKQFINHYGKK